MNQQQQAAIADEFNRLLDEMRANESPLPPDWYDNYTSTAVRDALRAADIIVVMAQQDAQNGVRFAPREWWLETEFRKIAQNVGGVVDALRHGREITITYGPPYAEMK